MTNVIFATLRLTDEFSKPLVEAIKEMSKCEKKAKSIGEKIADAGDSITKLGSNMKKGFTDPIVDVGKKSFTLAADLDASMKKVDGTFKSSSSQVKKWSKTTFDSYGIAQSTAVDMVTSYGDMASSMGISTSEATNMSKNMVSLTSDLASYKNISLDTASAALKGIFSGDTDALNDLGIAMSDAKLNDFAMQQGLGKSIDKMSEAEQAQLRYSYIIAKTRTMQGNYSRTSSTATNQQRKMNEGIKQLSAGFGQVLLPIGTKVLKKINGLISKFNGLSKSQKKTIVVIAGVVAAVGPFLIVAGRIISVVGTTIKVMKGMKDGFGKAKGAVKALKEGMSKERLEAIKSAAINLKHRATVVAGNVAKKASRIATNALTKAHKASGEAVKKLKSLVSKQRIEDIKSRAIMLKKAVATKVMSRASSLASKATKAMTLAQKGLKLAFVSTPIGWIVLGIMALIAVGILLVKNWKKVKAAAKVVWNGIKSVFGAIGTWFGGLWDGVQSGFKAFINFIIDGLNLLPKALNSISIKVPKWVPGIGGNTIGFNIPTIPRLAKGTDNWKGGYAITQEKGAEIMDLPRGTRVYPHDKSLKMAREEGVRSNKGNCININISKLADKLEVRNDNDIDKIASSLASRLEKVINNTGKVVYA